eukprot:1711497-Rhodomonas_salina.2
MNYFADFTRSVTGREVAPTQFVQAKAEELPFDDETFDIVVCTYLFHELPFPVRKQVLRPCFEAPRASLDVRSLWGAAAVCILGDALARVSHAWLTLECDRKLSDRARGSAGRLQQSCTGWWRRGALPSSPTLSRRATFPT